jgi:hypothetical protein
MRTGRWPVIVVAALLLSACGGATPSEPRFQPALGGDDQGALSPAPPVPVPSSASPSPGGSPRSAMARPPTRPALAVTSLTVSSQVAGAEVTGTVELVTSGFGTGELVLTFIYPTRGVDLASAERRFVLRGTGEDTFSRTFTVSQATVCAYASTGPGHRAMFTAAAYLAEGGGPIDQVIVACG